MAKQRRGTRPGVNQNTHKFLDINTMRQHTNNKLSPSKKYLTHKNKTLIATSQN